MNTWADGFPCSTSIKRSTSVIYAEYSCESPSKAVKKPSFSSYFSSCFLHFCKQSETLAPCAISEQHIAHLESLIDQIDEHLPPLRSFILPGGCMAASQCHVCRTICRRAERLIISLAETTPIDPLVASFINRLSDFLFVFARFINKLKSVDEISWKNDCI